MEVHKHPHHVTHHKKWFEYLLEFIMLFLAVYLGFIAENIRESNLEKHREKQFMESLVKDLKLDTAYLTACINDQIVRKNTIDTVVEYFKKHPDIKQITLPVVYQMRKTVWDRVFFCYNSTINQLNNSGNMRLISDRALVDSIENYYQQIERASFTRSAYLANQSTVLGFIQKLTNPFEAINFQKTLFGKRVIPVDDKSFYAFNNKYLYEYLGFLSNQVIYQTLNDINFNSQSRERGKRLITLIKNSYQL